MHTQIDAYLNFRDAALQRQYHLLLFSILGKIDNQAKCPPTQGGILSNSRTLPQLMKAFDPHRLSRMMVAQDKLSIWSMQPHPTVVTLKRCQSRNNHSNISSLGSGFWSTGILVRRLAICSAQPNGGDLVAFYDRRSPWCWYVG